MPNAAPPIIDKSAPALTPTATANKLAPTATNGSAFVSAFNLPIAPLVTASKPTTTNPLTIHK